MSSTPSFPSSFMRLTRSLSAAETWGFGLTGHIIWINVAPSVHAALGVQAMYVWIPAALIGMLLNFQVQRLGRHFIDVAGGTPNYATKLLEPYPWVARYAAIGYFFSWVSVLPINAIVLSDLITVNLAALGVHPPQLALKIGFTLLPFVVAFSGTRALSILHLFFVLPAIGLLLAFCLQGIGWLALSPQSPGFFPTDWSQAQTLAPLNFSEWAKWFLFVSYAAYACESASAFVADSRDPKGTLRFLGVAAWLMPCIYLGGSWVLMRLSTTSNPDNHFLSLLTASQPFWGQWAALIITFLLAADCLLSCATVVSNCPRMLHQLAIDQHLAPVFGVVSRRGVLGPALTLTLILSLACLFWGNVAAIVVVGNIGWFTSIMMLHLGLWLRRSSTEVLLPWLALPILAVEAVVLLVGGIAWGWQAFLIGLLLPIAILGGNAAIAHFPVAAFRPDWWIQRYRQRAVIARDSVVVQVSILIFLLCASMLVGWQFRAMLRLSTNQGSPLMIVLLLVVAFVGVAIACWTSLPQVVAITEARQAAEYLFTVAQDGILVLNQAGLISQTNPAAIALFNTSESALIGQPLNQWLTGLVDTPDQWLLRSEQSYQPLHQAPPKILEVSISDRSQEDTQEYVVILRDVTERKRAEEFLRNSESQLRTQTQQLEDALREVQQAQSRLVQSEKMSSLGQLVAGVAHEINNPVNFIAGNLNYADQYSRDLIGLVQLYQQYYPEPVAKVQTEAEAIELDFIVEDLPRLLNSMQIGTKRIQQIVLSLRNFSRTDESALKEVDLHEGIDSTLMILQSRLKSKSGGPPIQVIKQYGNLPLVECYAGPLNQVFMNILANAIDALEELPQSASSLPEAPDRQSDLHTSCPLTPTIWIHTAVEHSNHAVIRIKDNGSGIPDAVQKHLFDPFFTTKPVGKGTGLGLSISYEIVTSKHGGQLRCISSPAQGTEFVIQIPLQQNGSAASVT